MQEPPARCKSCTQTPGKSQICSVSLPRIYAKGIRVGLLSGYDPEPKPCHRQRSSKPPATTGACLISASPRAAATTANPAATNRSAPPPRHALQCKAISWRYRVMKALGPGICLGAYTNIHSAWQHLVLQAQAGDGRQQRRPEDRLPLGAVQALPGDEHQPHCACAGR